MAGIIKIQKSHLEQLLALPPCFRVGGERHHYYEPNCSGYSKARKIEYRINEAGIRERPSPEIRPGQILVLGDSVVEGWGVNADATIPAALEALNPRSQFLNAGLRYSGPVLQSLRLETLSALYRPRTILWFLSENDTSDDRLFFALGESPDSAGVPTRFNTRDYDFVASLLRWKEKFGDPGGMLSYFVYRLYHWNADRLAARWPDGQNACSGVRRGLRVAAERSMNVVFVAVPLGPYNSQPEISRDFDDLLRCREQRPLLDLRAVLSGRKDLFLEGDTHFNQEGSRFIALKIQEFLNTKL